MYSYDIELGTELFNDRFIPYVFEIDRHIELLFGGAGGSKTVHSAIKSIKRVWEGRNGLVIRQVAATLRDSYYADLKKAISILGLDDFFECTVSPLRIVCDNKKSILFRGLDKVEKLKGITFEDGELDFLVVEEITETQEDSINQLEFRIRGGGSKMPLESLKTMISEMKQTESLEELQSKDFMESIFNLLGFENLEDFVSKEKYFTGLWNPTDINHWIRKRWFFDSKGKLIFDLSKGDKELLTDDMYIMHSTHEDNQFLTPEDHRRYESYRFINPYFYNVYTLGNWGVLGDLVYKNFRHCRMTDEFINKLPLESLRNGLDFGYVDEFAIVKSSIDKKNRIVYVFQEFVKAGLTTQELISVVRDFVGYGEVICDSADRRGIEDLVEAGINADGAHKYEGHKERGWIWFQGYIMYIDIERCPRFAACISTYQWQKNKLGETIQKVQDGNDHPLDAFLYGHNRDIMASNQVTKIY